MEGSNNSDGTQERNKQAPNAEVPWACSTGISALVGGICQLQTALKGRITVASSGEATGALQTRRSLPHPTFSVTLPIWKARFSI